MPSIMLEDLLTYSLATGRTLLKTGLLKSFYEDDMSSFLLRCPNILSAKVSNL
jgi:hypothetical protein